jgi:hypothetical protein
MAGQKIRIRLKAYDHEVIDTSAKKIVETVEQGQPRTFRNAHPQAFDRHHRSNTKDSGFIDAPRFASWRRYRDQALIERTRSKEN